MDGTKQRLHASMRPVQDHVKESFAKIVKGEVYATPTPSSLWSSIPGYASMSLTNLWFVCRARGQSADQHLAKVSEDVAASDMQVCAPSSPHYLINRTRTNPNRAHCHPKPS